MNIQKMESNAERHAIVAAAKDHASKPKRRGTSSKSGKSGTKSKQDQLVALLSKPNGTRISMISERLGWQAHTVRAAISGLHKRGHEVVTSKFQKTGEMVYAINVGPKENETDPAEVSS